MADSRSSSGERSSPKNSVDTPEEIQRAGNGTDAWIRQGLNQLNSQIEKMDGKLDSRFDKIDGKLDSKFNKIDDRLRPIERRINLAIGGIVVAMTVISILGLILSPFLKAIAEKMVSGG